MATKRKKVGGNPAVSLRDLKLRRLLTNTFSLTCDLKGHISDSNHLVMQGTARAIMLLVDPEGELLIDLKPSKSFDKAKVTKLVFQTMKTTVELTKTRMDLEDEMYTILRSAAIGLMFIYAELTGLPDPIDVIFKDMVKEESDKAWDNKPANQNKLLRRKVNA